MEGMTCDLGELNASFDKMAVVLPDIEKKAVNTAAYELKQQIKSAFASKMPSSTRPVRNQTVSRGYKITTGEPLVDAVRQSAFKDGHVKVHILGANEGGSPLFMARFYENGTKERHAKTFRGKKLAKPRYLNKLTGVNYFMPTVEQYMQQTGEIIYRIMNSKIGEILTEM